MRNILILALLLAGQAALASETLPRGDGARDREHQEVKGQGPTPRQQLTEDEQDLIGTLERLKGRKLTQQEIDLALQQARALGEL